MSEKAKKLLVFSIPALFVLIVDQITKHIIRTTPEYHRVDLIEGWLAFNFTKNPGMAMGMDWLSTPVISVIAITATIGIISYIIYTLNRANFGYLVCMGLIIGGALGNIYDRLFMAVIGGYGGVLEGHVVDFIHFYLRIGDTPVFPYIFNVADIAITTSIIVMILFHKKIMPVDEEGVSDSQDASVVSREEAEAAKIKGTEELNDVTVDTGDSGLDPEKKD